MNHQHISRGNFGGDLACRSDAAKCHFSRSQDCSLLSGSLALEAPLICVHSRSAIKMYRLDTIQNHTHTNKYIYIPIYVYLLGCLFKMKVGNLNVSPF